MERLGGQLELVSAAGAVLLAAGGLDCSQSMGKPCVATASAGAHDGYLGQGRMAPGAEHVPRGSWGSKGKGPCPGEPPAQRSNRAAQAFPLPAEQGWAEGRSYQGSARPSRSCPSCR